MPLRDHFRPPARKSGSWERVHGQWPAMMVLALNRTCRRDYVAGPRVHHGASSRSMSRRTREDEPASADRPGADAAAASRPPSGAGRADPGGRDRPAGHRRIRGPRLRHASRANGWWPPSRSSARRTRTGPRHRRAFVAKCAALLQERVSVAVVDMVHRPGREPVPRAAGLDRPAGTAARRRSRRRCTPPPAAYREGGRAGGSRPGRSRWTSASRCRRCPSGSATTSRCRSTWKRATRRRAASSASRSRRGRTTAARRPGPRAARRSRPGGGRRPGRRRRARLQTSHGFGGPAGGSFARHSAALSGLLQAVYRSMSRRIASGRC